MLFFSLIPLVIIGYYVIHLSFLVHLILIHHLLIILIHLLIIIIHIVKVPLTLIIRALGHHSRHSHHIQFAWYIFYSMPNNFQNVNLILKLFNCHKQQDFSYLVQINL